MHFKYMYPMGMSKKCAMVGYLYVQIIPNGNKTGGKMNVSFNKKAVGKWSAF